MPVRLRDYALPMTPALRAAGLARPAWGIGQVTENRGLKENFHEDSPISLHDEASDAAALVSSANPGTGVAHSPVTAQRRRSRPSAQRDRSSPHHCRVVKRLTDRLESTSAAVRLSAPRLFIGAREHPDSQVRLRSPDNLSAVHAAHSRSWPRSPDVVRYDGTADNESSARSHACGR